MFLESTQFDYDVFLYILGLGLSIFCLGIFSYLFMCEISLGYLFFLLLTWCAFDIKVIVSSFSSLLKSLYNFQNNKFQSLAELPG